MVNYNVDKFIGIVNKNKEKYKIGDDYLPTVSMLRIENGKLYVALPLVNIDDKVWNKGSNVIPEYWALIDPLNMNLLELNKTSEKSFISGEIIKNSSDGLVDKEISKYIVSKKIEYKEYIKNDIKDNQLLSYQKKVSDSLNNVIKIDDNEISLNDYFYANFEDEINAEVDKLVDLIVASKYNSITTYYDVLFDNIISEYINENKIDKNKIKLASEIITSYYPGLDAIENLFNL